MSLNGKWNVKGKGESDQWKIWIHNWSIRNSGKRKILKNKTKKCCSNILIRDLDFLERKRKGKEWGLERK